MDPVYNVDGKEGQILWADLNVMQKSDDQALQMVRLCIFKMGTLKSDLRQIFFASSRGIFVLALQQKLFFSL